jgi:hypothetical protein
MRYFFHVRDGQDLLTDEVGVELPDDNSALDEAKCAARDFLVDNVKFGDPLDNRRFEVWDERGVPHFILPFKSVLGIE